jgi:hypothetical protein
MKRILIALGFLASLISGSAAQQTKSQLNTEVSTNYPDNTTGLITPSILRSTTNDLIASWQQGTRVNAQTGTTYTFVVGDYGNLVTFNNVGAIAASLPQATGSFATFNVYVKNLGAGTVTITPTTSTINGASSYALTTGVGAQIISDGVNYQVWTGAPSPPWSPQIHQDGGCANHGHVLAWSDCNFDLAVDFINAASADASQIYQYSITGSITGGNTPTFRFVIGGVNHDVVYTVQGGDTTTTIATAFAACINGGSTNCTGGPGLISAMAAFLGSDGIGYRPSAGSSTNSVFFDFPWAASGNSISILTPGTLTITKTSTDLLDIGPLYKCGRNVPGRTPTLGDELCTWQVSGQSGPNTGYDSTFGAMTVNYMGGSAGSASARIALGAVSAGTNAHSTLFVGPKGVYTSDTDGSSNPCNAFTGIIGDPGFGAFSACGQIFAGMHNYSGETVGNLAMIESSGFLRVRGNAQQPSSGQGIEIFMDNGASPQAGTIRAYNAGTTAFTPLHLGAQPLMVDKTLTVGLPNLTTNDSIINANLNAAVPPANPTTGAHLSLLDATVGGFNVDAFAQNGQNLFRRANGTNASPTGLVDGDTIGGLRWDGFAGASTNAYVGGKAFLLVVASGTWSNTNNATNMKVLLVAPSTTGVAETARFWGSGSFNATSSPTDAGAGSVVMKQNTTNKGATITATAPGAANGSLVFGCGTNAGTAALFAGSGTSTTLTRVLDNIGSGVTGC